MLSKILEAGLAFLNSQSSWWAALQGRKYQLLLSRCQPCSNIAWEMIQTIPINFKKLNLKFHDMGAEADGDQGEKVPGREKYGKRWVVMWATIRMDGKIGMKRKERATVTAIDNSSTT